MAKVEYDEGDGGWIKIFRRFLRWEWYDDTNMVRLFLHLLLKANYEPKKWHGISVKKGQLVSSISTLAKETHLTVKNIRTCLQRLIDTGEIGKQSASKYTIITICKYESYQQVDELKRQDNGKQAASKGQASGKQRATTKERKEYKEDTYSLTLVSNACAHAREKFVEWLEQECPYIASHLTLPTEEQFDRLKEQYTSEEIATCCQQIENRTDLRRRYKNLYLTLLNWLKRERNKLNDNGQRTTNGYGQGDNAQWLEQAAAYISSIRDGDFDADRPPV